MYSTYPACRVVWSRFVTIYLYVVKALHPRFYGISNPHRELLTTVYVVYSYYFIQPVEDKSVHHVQGLV